MRKNSFSLIMNLYGKSPLCGGVLTSVRGAHGGSKNSNPSSRSLDASMFSFTFSCL